MKRRLFSTLSALIFTSTAWAQNAAPEPAASPGRPLVRHVLPKPVSARPAGMVSVSTAEGGSLRGHQPLHHLPSFEATTIDGKTTDIATFKQPTHWLLLYRREDCPPCDRMVSALAGSENTSLKAGTALVIVVADDGKAQSTNRLDAVRAKFSTVSAATWLEDSHGAALKALQPRGTPMLYALSGDRIQWAIAGLLGDPAIVENMASSWVNGTDPAPPQSVNASAARAAATPARTSAKTPASAKH